MTYPPALEQDVELVGRPVVDGGEEHARLLARAEAEEDVVGLVRHAVAEHQVHAVGPVELQRGRSCRQNGVPLFFLCPLSMKLSMVHINSYRLHHSDM